MLCSIKRMYLDAVLILMFIFVPALSAAETVNIAVASNFVHTLKKLSVAFTRQTGYQLRISSASTGKLFTQIEHGAPFDLFLSADTARPEILVDKGLAEDEQLVYAIGQIVLIANRSQGEECKDILFSPKLKRLSIANPRTAPYGIAAREVMQQLGVWEKLQPRLVKGENIAQTLQFVTTKNADAGFVAKSMLNSGRSIDIACQWEVPAEMYSPISQKMVLLKRASGKAAARAFMTYMRSAQAREIIRHAGYRLVPAVD